LGIELSDFDAENMTLNGAYMWQVVEMVIGRVPTVLEVLFMYLFMSLSRILLQVSVSTNLFGPMRHQVDLRKAEVSILLFRNIYLLADIMPPEDHFAPLLGRRPTISVCFLVHRSLLHKFRSQRIGSSLRLFAGSPK
jgi:hypothetical protein